MEDLLELQTSVWCELEEKINLIGDINSKLKAIGKSENRIDLFLTCCLHRHIFSEQKVEDHMNCRSAKVILGSYDGLVAGLVAAAKQHELVDRAIIEAFTLLLYQRIKKEK